MALYRITSISSASIDRYPDNTNTQFTHHLPESLPLRPDRRYIISLLSLCIPTKIKSGAEKPSYINLHLNQLDSKNFANSAGGGSSSLRCLSKLVFPKQSNSTVNSSFYWLVVDNPNPLILNETLNAVQELSFELRDEQNNLLELESAKDTLVSCVIEEMEKIDRFTLTLNKSLSQSLYPDNSDIDFKVSFGHTALSTEDDYANWEMALHSVIVPSQICLDGLYFECTIDITTPEGTATSTKTQIENVGQSAMEVLKEIKKAVTDFNVLIFRQTVNKFKISIGGATKTLHFNTNLCQLLSIAELSGPGKGRTLVHKATEPFEDITLIDKLDPGLSIPRMEQIAIYSDMVQSSVVGNNRANLIDIISTSSLGLFDKTKDTLYNVMYPVFRPVYKPNMMEARIQLGDIYGKPVNLKRSANDESANIQYLFIFRK